MIRRSLSRMKGIAEIEKTVLALPLEQRVLLAESLLSSLPPMPEDWSEAKETEEVERREREIETGQVQPLSEEELLRRVEASRRK
jgi:putative addiction module component (TIGR02574 family)